MGVALALLILIVIPNLWATWKVSRARMPLHRKTIAILSAWIVPIVGAHTALKLVESEHAPLGPSTPIPRPQGRREAPPATLDLPGLPSFDLREHMSQDHGVPVLDFTALDEWAGQAATAEAAAAAREQGHRLWLLHFGHWLGESSHLVDAHGCWVLSDYSPGIASATCRFMADSRRRIEQLLSGLAEFPPVRSTFISLDDEDYYAYIANYYPEEGEFAFSGGMFINAGCPHFVALRSDLAQLEPVIAHEMTHFSLAHLSLPLWLDEGLAVNTEMRISSSYRSAQALVEMISEHHEFWNAETIQEFWSGQSFHRTDQGNKLSYDLARAIVDLIGRDWDSFTRFARQARREDGGADAARSELQLDLGELAAAAINMRPGDSWTPAPAAWEGVTVKARR